MNGPQRDTDAAPLVELASGLAAEVAELAGRVEKVAGQLLGPRPTAAEPSRGPGGAPESPHVRSFLCAASSYVDKLRSAVEFLERGVGDKH